MRKIAVYGSLRKGHGNYMSLLKNSVQLSEEVVEIPFKMISLGGFPGLIPDDENHPITIETYEVSEETYRNVECLEGYPNFYQKATIKTTQGEMEIYVLNSIRYRNSAPIVESGDWNQCYPRRYANV